MSSPPPVNVAPGTLLRLDPDDWSFGRDLTPGTRVDIVVVRLRTDLAHVNDDAMWVVGHLPQCSYSHIDEHPPCMEVRVKVAALQRHTSTP
ncbi:hypothetical protein [Micromonospora sp. NPDC048830]|uniref:hypothetical protein n=1 Tax=Micromonospora sp. NPDC048830 TaxID=3364257 RepID=UPI00371E9DE9